MHANLFRLSAMKRGNEGDGTAFGNFLVNSPREGKIRIINQANDPRFQARTLPIQ